MIQQSDEWLRRHQRVVLLALLVAGATLRGAYLYEIAASPLLWLQRDANSDMHFYDQWARKISQGDIWSKSVVPPLHRWHREVAEAFLERHPEERRALDPGGTLDHRQLLRKLWDRWCPPARLYQEPFYPYFVAAVYAVAGPDPLAVFIAQSLIGLLSVALIYAIGTRAFGETAGLISAVLLVGSPPLAIFDAVLMRDSQIIVAGLLTTFLLQRAKTAGGYALAGFSIGIALLIKSQFIVLGAAAVLYLMLARSTPWRSRLACLAALVLGGLAGIGPMLVRNAVVGVPLLAPPTGAYFTFIGANVPDYPGNGFSVSPQSCPELIEQSHGSLAAAIVVTLRSHPDVWSYLNTVYRHLDKTWRWYEPPNCSNLYYYQLQSHVLGSLPFGFSVIAPAGLVGLVLGFRRMPTLWPLYAAVLTNCLVLMLFFVIDRYRAPLAAGLIPFAALTFITLHSDLLERHWKRAVLVACALVALTGLILRPGERPQPTITMDDVIQPILFYNAQVTDALAREDVLSASVAAEKSVAVVPPLIRDLTSGRPVGRNVYDPLMVEYYQKLYENVAELQARAGRDDLARKCRENARHLGAALATNSGKN